MGGGFGQIEKMSPGTKGDSLDSTPQRPALREDPLLLLPTSLGVLAGNGGQMLGSRVKGLQVPQGQASLIQDQRSEKFN